MMRKDFENSQKKDETKVTPDYAHLAVTLVNNWRVTFSGFLKMHIVFVCVCVFFLNFQELVIWCTLCWGPVLSYNNRP